MRTVLRRSSCTTLVVLFAVASLAGCTAATSDLATPVPMAERASTTTFTAPATTTSSPAVGEGGARAFVDRLEVRTDPSGGAPPYRRAAFGDGWDYDPESGCNTRERVLIEESLVVPVVDDRCRSTGGRWRSIYDGLVTSDPADLEVDHVIPLADAWRSGAASWSDGRRRAFANDVEHPEALAAVSTRSNRSKGDSTPDQWLPADRGEWCRYATGWVELKTRWNLTVTANEKSTLVQVLNGC